MRRYLVRRSLETAVTFLVFTVLVFALIQALPGDFTNFFALDSKVSPEDRARIAASFGLDQPAWRQYLAYVGNLVQGDLGVSFSHYPRSVASILAERLPRTVLLFATATVISFTVGFWLGRIVAWRRGGVTEAVATVGGVMLYTAFTPWLGLILLWIFALRLGWFPVGKFLTPEVWTDAPVGAATVVLGLLASLAVAVIAVVGVGLWTRRQAEGRARSLAPALGGVAVASCLALVWFVSSLAPWGLDLLRHLSLPVLTLSLVSAGGVMLLTRNSMVDVMREDYVLAARARGLSDGAVRDRYVARNALLPIATSLVFSLAFAVDGGVIIEGLFAWPGMGMTLLDAAVAQDLPLAVGAFLLTGAFALAAHLAADLLNAILDPRVRDGRR